MLRFYVPIVNVLLSTMKPNSLFKFMFVIWTTVLLVLGAPSVGAVTLQPVRDGERTQGENIIPTDISTFATSLLQKGKINPVPAAIILDSGLQPESLLNDKSKELSINILLEQNSRFKSPILTSLGESSDTILRKIFDDSSDSEDFTASIEDDDSSFLDDADSKETTPHDSTLVRYNLIDSKEDIDNNSMSNDNKEMKPTSTSLVSTNLAEILLPLNSTSKKYSNLTMHGPKVEYIELHFNKHKPYPLESRKSHENIETSPRFASPLSLDKFLTLLITTLLRPKAYPRHQKTGKEYNFYSDDFNDMQMPDEKLSFHDVLPVKIVKFIKSMVEEAPWDKLFMRMVRMVVDEFVDKIIEKMFAPKEHHTPIKGRSTNILLSSEIPPAWFLTHVSRFKRSVNDSSISPRDGDSLELKRLADLLLRIKTKIYTQTKPIGDLIRNFITIMKVRSEGGKNESQPEETSMKAQHRAEDIEIPDQIHDLRKRSLYTDNYEDEDQPFYATEDLNNNAGIEKDVVLPLPSHKIRHEKFATVKVGKNDDPLPLYWIQEKLPKKQSLRSESDKEDQDSVLHETLKRSSFRHKSYSQGDDILFKDTKTDAEDPPFLVEKNNHRDPSFTDHDITMLDSFSQMTPSSSKITNEVDKRLWHASFNRRKPPNQRKRSDCSLRNACNAGRLLARLPSVYEITEQLRGSVNEPHWEALLWGMKTKRCSRIMCKRQRAPKGSRYPWRYLEAEVRTPRKDPNIVHQST